MKVYYNNQIIEIGEKPIRDPKTGQFLPGHEALSDGRPVGSLSLTERIKRKLKELSSDQKEEVIDKLAGAIIQSALNGSRTERKLIWNYLEGLPKASLELETDKETLAGLTDFFKAASQTNDTRRSKSI